MAVNQVQMVHALQTRLLTLSVATSGSISMSVAGSIITRDSGSFITDGFWPGMEIVGVSFSDPANDAVSVIEAVTVLTLEVNRTLVTEVLGAGKTVSVNLPSRRSWENLEFEPESEWPYIEENFLPGGNVQITVGPGGDIEADPSYVVKLFIPDGRGAEAAHAYGDALVSLFAPRTAMLLTNGDTLRVRTNPAPFRGQLIQRKPGWATVPVTIPLRIRTTNP